MITMKDVARLAGVSSSTISHVLNGTAPISDETCDKVNKIIKETGYTRNNYARRLKQKRNYTIGLITDDISGAFVSTFIKGIENYCNHKGYNIIFGNANKDRNKERLYYESFLGQQMEGILYVNSLRIDEFYFSHLNEKKVPTVLVFCYSKEHPENCIIPDDFSGGYRAIDHLAKLGHKRIAYISGPTEWKASQDRLKGYQAALLANSLIFDPRMIKEGTWRFESGLAAANELLSDICPPTAIFAANDYMALGVIEAAVRKGINIPKELAIVGFDNREVAHYSRPALTTIEMPLYKMGETAAHKLINEIEGVKEEIKIVLDCELIIRDSCGFKASSM